MEQESHQLFTIYKNGKPVYTGECHPKHNYQYSILDKMIQNEIEKTNDPIKICNVHRQFRIEYSCHPASKNS